MTEIKTLKSKIVYENRWMKVREDAIRYPDGSESIYGVVDKHDAAMVFALDDDNNVYLVEQFRYPVGQRFWELPQGAWQGQDGVDPLTLAHGELQEETGLTAGRMTFIGQTFEAYGFAAHKCHIFLAQDLHPGRQSLDAEEQGLICRRFQVGEAVDMIFRGEIRDAGTIAAFGLLRLKNII
ncbi:NUDIX hydrolase [Brucellaceae bacterium VT-16-1752]|uniref:NUDIX domain-containing protein n=1 Tax=Brucella/Ochrobactrum group TaxID=2826938 RepID=UPI000F5F5866|nr:NUDIX hydrolase [Brucella sp. NM4]RRD21755.1 NUDIX hydrolase [Brucellaceae bacterium VT-16-1752]WHS33218.1 NUDIX hydrolase [Brucella sp. NM4]WHT43319.1 NUDIX hydrolase [Ochrobactrum sp. SSR]